MVKVVDQVILKKDQSKHLGSIIQKDQFCCMTQYVEQ